jgi:hypothetical protein
MRFDLSRDEVAHINAALQHVIATTSKGLSREDKKLRAQVAARFTYVLRYTHADEW